MKICAVVLVFMAAGLATCEPTGLLSWLSKTTNNHSKAAGRLKYVAARRNEKKIDNMISSSNRLEKLVQWDCPWAGRRDGPTALDVHQLLQELGHKDPVIEYTNEKGHFKIDQQMFDQALNRFLVPDCRDLVDQIRKLDVSVGDMMELDDGRYSTVISLLSLQKLCRYALKWTSTNTSKLEQELSDNHRKYLATRYY